MRGPHDLDTTWTRPAVDRCAPGRRRRGDDALAAISQQLRRSPRSIARHRRLAVVPVTSRDGLGAGRPSSVAADAARLLPSAIERSLLSGRSTERHQPLQQLVLRSRRTPPRRARRFVAPRRPGPAERGCGPGRRTGPPPARRICSASHSDAAHGHQRQAEQPGDQPHRLLLVDEVVRRHRPEEPQPDPTDQVLADGLDCVLELPSSHPARPGTRR